MDKKCIKCNSIKDINEFRKRIRNENIWYERKCKKCTYQESKEKIEKIKTECPEKYNNLLNKRYIRDKKHYSKNKQKINKRNNNYYTLNKLQISNTRKIYKLNNPDKVKKWKNSYRDSINGRLSARLRGRIRKEIGSGKKWLELLDCSIDNIKLWFEYNFDLDEYNNFNWSNYGKIWEIDHVIPCKLFDMRNIDECKKCFNWKNTIPVTKSYNKTKSGKFKLSDILKIELRLYLFVKKIKL